MFTSQSPARKLVKINVSFFKCVMREESKQRTSCSLPQRSQSEKTVSVLSSDKSRQSWEWTNWGMGLNELEWMVSFKITNVRCRMSLSFQNMLSDLIWIAFGDFTDAGQRQRSVPLTSVKRELRRWCANDRSMMMWWCTASVGGSIPNRYSASRLN
jgi:hypothetical protein